VAYTPAAEELARLNVRQGDGSVEKFKAWRPKGCSNCLNTGYKGRVGVFEIFEVTPVVREMILREQSEREIHKIALEQGLLTLQADGLDKVSKGLTSLSEFRRVLNF
jgi:type IV pilus assembly protein PilB